MTENYSTQNTLDMLAKMLADPSNVTDDATDTTPNVDGRRPQGLGRPSLGKREPISGPLQQISYAMGMFNPKLDKGNVPKKVDLDAEGFMTKLQANWDRLVPFKLRGEQLATDAPYKARGNTTFSQEPMTNADASPLLSGTGVSSNDMPPLTPAEQSGVDVALAAQGNGLMSRPASDAAPTSIESSELMVSPKIRPADLSLEGLRSIEDGEYSFKASDYLKSKIDPSYEVDDSKLAITGNDFTDRDAALSEITKIAYKKYLPLQAAALLATAEAESSTSLVEDPYYRRSSALSKLAGGSTERKAAIEAIYSDPDYLRDGSVPGSDDALVNTAGAKKLFNIAYDDQYRSKDSKLGNDKVGDGYKYRGRGLIQITGKYNYAKYGKAIGVGDALVKNPELLLTDPKVMAAVTIAYLDDKDFANKATSEEGLRSVIVHNNSKDDKGVKPSTKRWERTLEIAKAAATKDVTSKLAERTRRPNSNQGF